MLDSRTAFLTYNSFTTETGMFEFFDVLEGDYQFECSANGYKVFSAALGITGANPTLSLGTLELQFDYCATNPPCSGHGQCDGVGVCACDDGWTGISCADSILPAECATHRGFSEEDINDVLVLSALHKNYAKLSHLLDNLQNLAEQLPAYQSNSCCSGNDGFTYPIEVASLSTSSYMFLQNLMEFNEDSMAFRSEVTD